LDDFSEKQFFSRVPLLVLTLQVVGIILYYLVMVATMLVDRQSGEIALLKSRGAGVRHIVTVYAVEGLALAGIAIIVGPLLALGVISLLGVTPPFTDLSGGGFLSVRLSGEAYIWAGVGAALSAVALVWPAYRASRYSIVRYKQAVSRPPDRSVFQRYYLDIVVVVAGAILFFQLQESNSVVTEDLFGGLEQDPLLLVAPAVFIIAVAVVFLRVFPLLLGLVSWLTDRFAGIAVQLGLWHLMRAPLQHARLVFLFVLATSIAMFSATFGSTLDRSFDDRANYEAGAPLRLSKVRLGNGRGAEQFREVFLAHPGVAEVSPVIRSSASAPLGAIASIRAELLAVDPETFTHVAWFRDDLAGQDLESLLEPIADNGIEAPTLPIPAEARRLGIWVQAPPGVIGIGMAARIRDADGRYTDVPLLGLDPRQRTEGGWRLLVAPLDADAIPGGPAPNLAEGPKDVVAVFTQTRGFSQFQGQFFWDDLQYSLEPGLPDGIHETGFSDGVLVDGFEDLDRWELLSGVVRDPIPDQLSLTQESVRSGRSALRYSWNRLLRSGRVPRGIRLVSDDEPLAVLVSENFLTEAGLRVGDEATFSLAGGFIPVRVAGSFELFPTFDPRVEAGLVVANIGRLSWLLNRNPGSTPGRLPNEAWIRPSEPGGLELLRADIEAERFGPVKLADAAALRGQRNEDPLIAAGWEGLLFISFLTVLILSALGFLVFSFLTAQTRALEFALLRAMGFSIRQILALLSFEQLFIVAVAMGLGTIVGMRLGVLMIEFLGVTERGEEVIPPLVLVTDWTTIGVAYGILAAVFLVTIAAVVAINARVAVHRVLRLGES
ncbi:MAG: FtsX-like permease family protein, partial [Dehalococcoidia bacterium]